MSKPSKVSDLLSSAEQSRSQSTVPEPEPRFRSQESFFKPVGIAMENEAVNMDSDFSPTSDSLRLGPIGIGGRSLQIGAHESAARSDGKGVMTFLNSESNLDLDGVFAGEERKANHPYDTNFTLPQTTRSALIQDGQDIVDYLRKNRYHEDMRSRTADFDVNSLISDFEQNSDSDERLQSAVSRLELLLKHLGQ